jgi:maltose O-acetyltransferase
MDELKQFAAAAKFNEPEKRNLAMAFFQAVFRVFSDGAVTRHPDGGVIKLLCPLRVTGKGVIMVRGTVGVGVLKSPYLLSGAYIEARTPESRVFIDDGTVFNNNACIMSDGAQVSIGKRCYIGSNFFCVDSNFHDLRLERRAYPDPDPRPVAIEDDVFVGEGVKILKGARIGRGSIIAAGAVLFPGFECPPNSTVGGNPAVIMSRRDDQGRAVGDERLD